MVNSITEAILEKLDALVVIINGEGQVDYVSAASQKILGYKPEQLLGEGWYSLTRSDEEERRNIKTFVHDLIKQDSNTESLHYERILLSSEGIKKWILWSTTKGPDNCVIGIGQDITDRKKSELKLHQQNLDLSVRNKEMHESLHYARTIQEAMLSSADVLKSAFNDSFIIYEPKDVVSGDFYFFHEEGNLFYAAAVDCTGHGVPGAMMSVLGHSLLKDIIVKEKVTDPKLIIERLDQELHLALNKNAENPRSDGMDVALIIIDRKERQGKFCGAFRPLIIVRNNELIELMPSKFPVGFFKDVTKQFVLHEFTLHDNDRFYIFSDGYIDQFGGEKDKKFNKRRFKEILLSSQDMTTEEQGSYLEYALRNWKQDTDQTDDILVAGFRYNR